MRKISIERRQVMKMRGSRKGLRINMNLEEKVPEKIEQARRMEKWHVRRSHDQLPARMRKARREDKEGSMGPRSRHPQLPLCTEVLRTTSVGPRREGCPLPPGSVFWSVRRKM